MLKLFQFIYRYRSFIVFAILEIMSLGFLVNTNSYQGAIYFNSANKITGNILQSIDQVNSYFKLRHINDQLVVENAFLRTQLTLKQNISEQDTTNKAMYIRNHAYRYIAAKVVNNSITKTNNYITINRGTEDSIKVGMGVISPLGVVGKINSCSPHFSTAISLLHSKWQVSAQVLNSKIDGTVKWDGKDPQFAEMLYVGVHHKLKVNDTIVTSGYNAIYPKGIMVGKVSRISLDQGRPFYKIKIALATDFSKLNYVYVIENNLTLEKETLEADTISVLPKQNKAIKK